MDKVDAQLATIIQDIKSPTLDGLRAATVADGLGDIIAGLVFLMILIGLATAALRVSETKSRFMWFKPTGNRPTFDSEEVNMFRFLCSIGCFVCFGLCLLAMASPTTWLKVFYPDAIIAQRVLTRR